MEGLTYGERRLRKAEFRAARRRRAATLLPGVAVIFWSLADLVAARHHRVIELNAGFLDHLTDHIQPIGWTVLIVLLPFLVAMKPKPKRSGSVLALFTGPVLTPLIFGSGGWRLWQIALLAALVLWIESQDQVRARRLPADTGSSAAVEEASLHAISGASFQRRSSS